MDLDNSGRFLKDLKLAKRRGLDLSQLKNVTDMLQAGKKLIEQFRNHSLTGNYKDYRECHISSDWLLIYRKKETIRVISLYHMGTHSDLFR